VTDACDAMGDLATTFPTEGRRCEDLVKCVCSAKCCSCLGSIPWGPLLACVVFIVGSSLFLVSIENATEAFVKFKLLQQESVDTLTLYGNTVLIIFYVYMFILTIIIWVDKCRIRSLHTGRGFCMGDGCLSWLHNECCRVFSLIILLLQWVMIILCMLFGVFIPIIALVVLMLGAICDQLVNTQNLESVTTVLQTLSQAMSIMNAVPGFDNVTVATNHMVEHTNLTMVGCEDQGQDLMRAAGFLFVSAPLITLAEIIMLTSASTVFYSMRNVRDAGKRAKPQPNGGIEFTSDTRL